jgi:hypothetical protein
MSPTQAVQDTENEDEWLTGTGLASLLAGL